MSYSHGMERVYNAQIHLKMAKPKNAFFVLGKLYHK